MRATLVIPTLNEEASIGHVLETFRAAAEEGNRTLFVGDPVDWTVLVVDGRSTDRTAEIARAHGAIVHEEPRRGYGRAYRTGFALARGDYLATLDGDATYPAEEVPRLLRRLVDERLDFLTTDRLAALDPRAMSHEHRIGNWVLNSFLAIAFRRYFRASGRPIRDSQSGMWVLRRSLLESISLTQDGMAMSEELKLEVLLSGRRYEELPIRYAERWGAPKLSSWRDGLRNLDYLVRRRLALRGGALPGAAAAVGGASEPSAR